MTELLRPNARVAQVRQYNKNIAKKFKALSIRIMDEIGALMFIQSNYKSWQALVLGWFCN